MKNKLQTPQLKFLKHKITTRIDMNKPKDSGRKARNSSREPGQQAKEHPFLPRRKYKQKCKKNFLQTKKIKGWQNKKIALLKEKMQIALAKKAEE